MNIIVRVITGPIQDRDSNSYDNVTIVYVALSMGCVVVSLSLVLISCMAIDLRRLQWTRKQRIANGDRIGDRRDKFSLSFLYGGIVSGAVCSQGEEVLP